MDDRERRIPTPEELEALTGVDASPLESAQHILEEGVVVGAQAIVTLAAHGQSERLRLDAAKFLIEYGLGRGASSPTPLAQAGWERLLGAITHD